ncbi:MAG: A/G-specific adenine glycosylase [Chthonomonadales bacterium]
MCSCAMQEVTRADALEDAGAIASSLVRWFRMNQRDLPWRRRLDDAYSVWVSEVMLQQTQAAAVEPYYLRWMQRWPTVEALAAAPLDDVLAVWSGLGYYARARNLHRAAAIVVERFGGIVPSDPATLASLPGVGAYTKGALLSIAFNRPFPAIDGNASRVLSRLLALDASGAEARRTAAEVLTALMTAESPREISQAVMELGALVCLPAKPQCSDCPVRRFCRAADRGQPNSWPRRRCRKPVTAVTHAAIVIEANGAYLMVRRHREGRWGGLWEFPRRECMAHEAPGSCAERAAREVAGVHASSGACVASVRHRVTRYSVTLHAYRARDWTGIPEPVDCAEVAWVDAGALEQLPLSSPQRTVVRHLLSGLRVH